MSTRWFTDAASVGPAPIRPSLTACELLHIEAIQQFAAHRANHEWENLRCLDADGTRFVDMSVGYKSAPLTDKMKAAIQTKAGFRQWHNHPSQDSISHSDWHLATTETELEILACNSRSSIYVGRVMSWDVAFSFILPWLPRLSHDLENHVMDISDKRKLNIDYKVELHKFVGHILNCALARSLPIRYAWCFTPDDDAVVAMLNQQKIIQDGITFADDAIKLRISQGP